MHQGHGSVFKVLVSGSCTPQILTKKDMDGAWESALTTRASPDSVSAGPGATPQETLSGTR